MHSPFPGLEPLAKPGEYKWMTFGGENDVWRVFCAERNIHFQFQGKGAHAWMSELSDCLARGIHCCPSADGPFPDRATLYEVRFRLDTSRNHGRFSALEMVLRPNPAG